MDTTPLAKNPEPVVGEEAGGRKSEVVRSLNSVYRPRKPKFETRRAAFETPRAAVQEARAVVWTEEILFL